MTQITKDTFGDNIDARYTANGIQAITGPIGNLTFEELKDSVVWYDERMNAIVFQTEVLHEVSGTPSSPTVGDVRRQNWEPLPSSSATVNAPYSSIAIYSAGVWELHPDFDVDNDYVIYEQGTVVGKGKNWLYDHRKLEGPARWIDIKENRITPHNYSLYLQGGAPDEYYHITAALHALVGNLNNNLFEYMQFIALEVAVYGASPSIAEVVSNHYLAEVDSLGSGAYLLREWDGSSWVSTDVMSAGYTYNPIIYAVDTNNYILDRNNPLGENIFIKQNKNIAVNHNEIQNLQGGSSTEKYHITADEAASIGATNSSYYLYIDNVHQVVATVSAITYSGPVNDDYVIVNAEPGNTIGQKLYRLVGGTWTLQTTIDNRYEVYNIDDGQVYFYDTNETTVGAFVAKGTNKLTYHNWQQGLQGGSSSERYHVNENIYNGLNATIQENIIVYIDPVLGLDTNTGLTTGDRILTVARLVEVLNDYIVDSITLNITSSTVVSFNIGTLLDSYIEKVGVKNIYIIGSGSVTNYSSATIGNGLVNTSTLPSLNLCSVALASGYYIIDGTPFIGNSGIVTGTGSATDKVFVTSKYLTNGTFDITSNAVTVVFSTEVAKLNIFSVSSAILETTIDSIDDLILNNAVLSIVGSITVNNIIGLNSIIEVSSIIINTYAEFNRIINNSKITNLGVINFNGFVNHNGNIENKGIINNFEQSADSVIAFLNMTSLFKSDMGSEIKIIDTPHILLVNPDSTNVLDSDSDKFNNVLTYYPPDALESDNENTYVPGVDNDLIYNSEDTNLDVNIGLLRFLSNTNHVRLTGVTIDTTATVAATIELGNFIINSSIKLKISVEDTVTSKHYYKDVHVIMNDTGVNSVFISLDGVDNSSGIVETTTGMFNITTNTLDLTLQAPVAIIANIDVEIERTMR